MDESSTANDFGAGIGEYEQRPYVADAVSQQRSDKNLEDPQGYVVVNLLARDRVVVWTSPQPRRTPNLTRFANRLIAGDIGAEDQISSD